MKRKLVCFVVMIGLTIGVCVGCGNKEKAGKEDKAKQEEAAKELREGGFKPSSGKTW